ncbi:hypothetical protein BaRGS_00009777 [Batillaria attramentaria]|uniref:Photolyase/cryptochrome alpha/beta domain-containing protein n=1 Tax=Batillaria attramentaria TaxID=370345 RepID=A0ABD0LHR6_9CAEN
MEEAVRSVVEFVNGTSSAGECFCIVVSLLGEEQTKREFGTILLKAGLRNNGLLHKQLNDVYSQYFGVHEEISVPTTDDTFAAVESFGDDLDLELALALSVVEKSVSSTDSKMSSATGRPSSNEQTYASKIKSPNLNPTAQRTMVQTSHKQTPPQFTGRNGPVSIPGEHTHTLSVQKIDEDPHAHTASQVNEQISKRKKKKQKKTQQHPGVQRHISSKPVICWLRRDLRLYDNPALVAAYESSAPVILTFFWNEAEEGPLAAGGASKYWLHFALKELNSSIERVYNNQIVFRKVNSSLAEMKSLVSEVGAGTLIMNNLYEPCLKARDDKICKQLESQGVEVKRFHSYLLHEPGSVNTESMGMRGIGSVTHFMEDGTVIDWAKGIRESWDFSEDGAWNALELFVDEGIRHYEKESGRADMLNTSRSSPYLHFGQVSPRAVLRHAQGMKSPKFLRKLAWRDLSYWLLTLFPEMPSKPMRPHYQAQRWSQDKSHLRAWQKGKTGYPLVDAAMRQLWLTGWMNNYTRHVVASFLISYLHLHWEHGYAWFQLAALPDDFIHKPWKCPPSVLRRAGVELGKTYPHRIITDLEEAREQSLRDVVTLRLANHQYVDPYTGNDLVPLPSGLLLPVITRKEFKYKTANPHAKDNPHTAVLRGYRSRKRDEAIAFANQVDFTASTMNECALRQKRYEQANRQENWRQAMHRSRHDDMFLPEYLTNPRAPGIY